jgi:hypothetical protein
MHENTHLGVHARCVISLIHNSVPFGSDSGTERSDLESCLPPPQTILALLGVLMLPVCWKVHIVTYHV